MIVLSPGTAAFGLPCYDPACHTLPQPFISHLHGCHPAALRAECLTVPSDATLMNGFVRPAYFTIVLAEYGAD